MTADQREREKALEVSQSFIVEAPAGSGKTGLLVQRYLALLSAVERPESIVAMTFTRRAAAEMKERIQDALQNACSGAAVAEEYERRTRDLALRALEQDRKKEWRLLLDPARLQIQTIDSLCGLLTRQMPVVSEFGGIGRVVEDATDLYHIAARAMLRDLAEGDTASRELFLRVSLYFDNDINSLERQVARMLEQRDQWFSLERVQDGAETEDFCQLLMRARECLREVFRQRGVVDFTEVTRAAIKALGPPDAPSDLLFRLDYRIEHLLVDEFQDTSRAQYDLIAALTGQWSDGDGHTLFLVGDPMQSIYRFRGAEVSLFLKSLRERRLGSVRLNPLRLSVNFRSAPQIVNWVGEKFTSIMPEDDAIHGAVAFRSSSASRPNGVKKPELIPLVDDDGSEEAREIVRIVSEIPEKGNVAILVRSRSHIAAILPALREAGIPYEAIEIDELNKQQHILDLISLTRAILHAGDRLSWLACLRAPWCGLMLADLSALAEGETKRTILDLISDPVRIAMLSSEGRSRVLRLQEILSAAVASAGRMPLRDLVEKTWMLLGGPAILQEANQQEDVDTFLSLLENCEDGGVLRDFSLLEQRVESLYAKPKTGTHCVQVMTIFQAKGLEFDVVILPKLGMATKSSERDLLAWVERVDEGGTASLAIAPQPRRSEQSAGFDEITEEVKRKERHELKRVFYVACTRARNELYLIGSVKSKKQGTECSKAREGTFLHLLWDGVQSEFESVRRGKIAARRIDSSALATAQTTLRRLPANWRAPRMAPSVEWQPEFHRATASAQKITYEWVGDTGRHAGTVVHGLLKRIAQEGCEAWNATRIAAVSSIVESELLRLGVPRSEKRAASERVIRAVTNTLGSERGRWILHSHAESRSEWALAGRIQDKLISGTSDRVFRDEQGRLWIVDFKTSEHEGGRREWFLDEQQRRYRPQLENYGTLISRLMPGPIWLGLYFPLLDGWREWQFEEEAALTV